MLCCPCISSKTENETNSYLLSSMLVLQEELNTTAELKLFHSNYRENRSFIRID